MTPKRNTLSLTPKRKILKFFVFFSCLLLAYAWIFAHAYITDAVIVKICDIADEGQRTDIPRPALIVGPGEADGLMWNLLAEEIEFHKDWRIRKTTFDNPPNGREVHWISGYAWFLRGLGEIYRGLTNQPIKFCISRMSIWANSILLAFAVTFLGYLCLRWFGLAGSFASIFGMICLPQAYEQFLPAYPDHHGLILCALVGMILCLARANFGLLAGDKNHSLPTSVTPKQTKRAMFLAGFFGGAALWVSSLSASLMLIILGLALLLYLLKISLIKPSTTKMYYTELLKLWGACGGATSLAFYLLEYFPNHLSMRLEVNHPFYSLSFFSGAWFLTELSTWISGKSKNRYPFLELGFLSSIAGCLLLPLTIFLFRSEVYMPLDPLFVNIMSGISELQPVQYFARLDAVRLTQELCPLLMISFAGAWIFSRCKINDDLHLVISILLFTFLFSVLALLIQKRWALLAGASGVALGVITTAGFFHKFGISSKTKCIMPPVGTILTIGAAWLTYTLHIEPTLKQFRQLPKPKINPVQAIYLLHRDLAKYVLASAKDQQPILLSSPNNSILIAGMGGFKTVGTLYWENLEGLEKMTRVLAARSDEEALSLIQAMGVTHVALLSWGSIDKNYVLPLRDSPTIGDPLQGTLIHRALEKDLLPLWLRPLPIPPHPLANAMGIRFLLLQVVPNQSPAEACLHSARFARIHRNDLDAAERLLRAALQLNPGLIAAQHELAFIKRLKNSAKPE